MKSFALSVCAGLLASGWLVSSVFGQGAAGQAAAGKSAPPAKETAELQKSAEAFQNAFNRGDAKTVAALWTLDGDYVDEAGQKFVGRAAIEAEYAQFFAEHPGAKITIAVDSLRVLGAESAIEDGRAVVELGRLKAPNSSKYTAVHTKVGGKWLMSTVRDFAGPPAETAGILQDFEWLVGKWHAEEHGSAMNVECRWIAGKKYLQRSYAVTRGDEELSSGVQIIGWNPEQQAVQSWTFTSDGGHAVGVWQPHASGWQVQMSGMLADGTPTSATNIFSRIDDNALAWQSIKRSAGGVSLEDAPEVLLKRVVAEQAKK